MFKQTILAITLAAVTATSAFAVNTNFEACSSVSHNETVISQMEQMIAGILDVRDHRPSGSPDWSSPEWQAYSEYRANFYASNAHFFDRYDVSGLKGRPAIAAFELGIEELNSYIANAEQIERWYSYTQITLQIIADLQDSNVDGVNDAQIAIEHGRLATLARLLNNLGCAA